MSRGYRHLSLSFLIDFVTMAILHQVNKLPVIKIMSVPVIFYKSAALIAILAWKQYQSTREKKKLLGLVMVVKTCEAQLSLETSLTKLLLFQIVTLWNRLHMIGHGLLLKRKRVFETRPFSTHLLCQWLPL